MLTGAGGRRLGLLGVLLPLAGLAIMATAAEPDGVAGQGSDAGPPPERITLLVPGGTGGGTDALARRLAILLSEPLGKPVTVVNKPGEGGLEAIDALRQAPPDGLTLGLLTADVARRLEAPAAAVTPILLITLDPPALHVRAGDDGQAALTAVLGGRARASGGPARSLWHLALAGLADGRGRTLGAAAWRPAARAADAINALVQGEVRLVVAEAGQGEAARRADEVLTFTGAVGAEPAVSAWRGLAGPPGMSPKRAERLAADARSLTGSATFRKVLRGRGYAPADHGPNAFATFLESFARSAAGARAALE